MIVRRREGEGQSLQVSLSILGGQRFWAVGATDERVSYPGDTLIEDHAAITQSGGADGFVALVTKLNVDTHIPSLRRG